MANHNHIVLSGEYVEAVSFRGQGRGDKKIPDRNAMQHADFLAHQYAEAVSAYQALKDELPEGLCKADGIYMNFCVDERAQSISSLNGVRGARLMNVRDTEDSDIKEVTIFLPSRRNAWFESKLTQYRVVPTEGHRRANEALVNSVADISAAELQKFFVNNSEYETILDNRIHEIELWLSEETYDEDRVRNTLNSLHVECGNDVLVFELVRVMLIRANCDQLRLLMASLNGLSEFRLHHRPSVLTRDIALRDQNLYSNMLADIVPSAPAPLVRIGVLDTGAPQSHVLLDAYLPEDRKLSAYNQLNWRDRCPNGGHGTGMCSLALYGDLSDAVYQPSTDPIVADLVSVKITHDDDEGQYSNKIYAIEAQDAIEQARRKNASILCSAVTSCYESDSKPTSWSAAIDESLYNDGACDSIMLLSAGNVLDNMGLQYPDYLLLSPALDPAQSWNALTVGAFTEKVLVDNPNLNGCQIVAPGGGVSPFSRTSNQWGRSVIKPEIVMEGGNAYWQNNQLELDDDLMLVGANKSPIIHQFTPFAGTSPATALAARLASQIKYKYLDLHPLTIRALMVHSAEWTKSMLKMATNDGRVNKDLLLHTCGYGVPNKQKALVGNESRVTFISEETIRPFVEGGSQLKYGLMNLHEIPWPEEVLQQLQGVDVTMKVTLSYYIDPCPGARGKLRKYSYQSLRLKFDVIRPVETLAGFKRRISHVIDDDNDQRLETEVGSLPWSIGVLRRNQGSIISDAFTLTAAQMAKCRYIAIYPSSGWFKYKTSKADAQVRYSLVVSLETPEQDIYTEIAQKVGIATALPIVGERL